MTKITFVFIILILILGTVILFYGNKKSSTNNPVLTSPTKFSPEATASPSPVLPTVKEIALNIIEPADDATINDSTLVVKGKTVPNASVNVDDNELKADDGGSFSTTITLDEGENIIIITANDDIGNFAEKDLIVIYEVVN